MGPGLFLFGIDPKDVQTAKMKTWYFIAPGLILTAIAGADLLWRMAVTSPLPPQKPTANELSIKNCRERECRFLTISKPVRDGRIPEELAELKHVTNLSLNGAGIKDLTPVGQMPWLESLSAFGGRLSPEQRINAFREAYGHENWRKIQSGRAKPEDFPPLETEAFTDLDGLNGLPSLQNLTLKNFDPIDTSSLSHHQMLTKLNIIYSVVSNPEVIGALPTLEELVLKGSSISDIGFLSTAPSLTFLDLSGTEVSDIAPLQDVKTLRSLVLSGNVTDLAPLSGLSQLAGVFGVGPGVTDLGPLRTLSNLRRLRIQRSDIADLGPIANAGQLRDLEINGSKIADLSPLAGMTKLEVFQLYNSLAEDLSPLADSKKLEILFVGNTPITKLDGLQDLPVLQRLRLQGIAATDYSVLGELKTLDELDLSASPVRDINFVASLSQLEDLFLSGTPIEDISPLAGLPRLRRVNLRGTRVRDFTPLLTLPNLAWVLLEPTSGIDPDLIKALKEKGVNVL